MNSFHQSRGRILFEVACALTISASCVGAWMQTYASAFLPAAAAAALYGLVHAFDLAKARPALAAPMPSVETPADLPEEISHEETMAPPPLEEAPSAEEPVAAAELTEPATDDKPKPRRAKAPRRAKGSAKETVTQFKPVEVAIAVSDSDLDSSDLDSSDLDSPDLDSAPIPIAPLFEAEPFVRQQRTVFGRKSG